MISGSTRTRLWSNTLNIARIRFGRRCLAKASFATRYTDFLNQYLPHVALQLDHPDESWVSVDGLSSITGHYSLWYKGTPRLDGKTAGFIGHYFARDLNAGMAMLEHASHRLTERGVELAVGPVDGSTWSGYRLVVETSGLPRFLMEPENPIDYRHHFEKSGFSVCATYSSSILSVKPQFACNDPGVEYATELPGVTIRGLNKDDFDAELERMYGIACNAFCNNYLYSGIDESEFVTRYRGLKTVVDPELFLVAEKDGRPVAFSMTLRDSLNSRNGEETAVIKTLARRQDRSLKGLGLRLTIETHERAFRRGFKKIIHALYKDDNISSSFSTIHDAAVFRKYAVFSKPLRQRRTGL